ncbi:MAG TPA: AsmA-like C-terminal region-containing protein, partial [Acetobacteraceae bacterium]|nr:AsmA-like C-terminal region-containing protein [Acetobacteraceae bacterium]
RAPRLHAFSLRSGQTLRLLSKAEGRAAAHVDVDVPLKKHVKVKDVALVLSGHLADFSLPLPLGSLALRDGAVRLDADIHHLRLAGSAMLADEPSRFSGEVGFDRKAQDFNLRLCTILDRRLLAQAGLSAGFWSAGSAPLTVRLGGAPGGTRLALRADLAGAVVTFPALGWAKQAGAPGTAALDLLLPRNGPEEIERIAASAPGFALAARGDGASLDLGTLDVGRSRTSGKITPPARPGAPWMVALAGPVLDLSAALKTTQTSSAPGKPASRPLSWQLRGAFDHVLLRRRPIPGGLTALHVHVLGTGGWIGSLHATGLLDGSHPITLAMAPGRGGQAISLRTSDGGALLDALGMTNDIQNGDLDFTAERAMGRMSGRAVMTGFRLRHAPLIGKILQGMTLYGVPEAASGPGLAFSRLTAPFTLYNHVLTIERGRAFSASLGLTAAGRVDLARGLCDLSGTIVPAYALNSLPGRIPLLGRLFRTTKGSGLFSARYTVDGLLAAPHIVVYPLAALAPGALGGIFGHGPARRD